MDEKMMVCYLRYAQTALQIPATHSFLAVTPLIRNLAKHPRLFSAALDNHERGPPLSGEGEQSPGLRGRSGPSPRPFLRRTPTGILRNCNAGFKSPIQSPRSCQSDGVSKEALQREVEELKQKDLAVDQEIAQLLAEGYSLEELEKHISLLHEYNDIKDTGQMLLGKLATIRGVTTKELYPKFDLELTD